MGLAHRFRGPVQYHQGRNMAAPRAGMALEKELSVLHLVPKKTRRRLNLSGSWEARLKAHSHSDTTRTHLLTVATPWANHIQTATMGQATPRRKTVNQ